MKKLFKYLKSTKKYLILIPFLVIVEVLFEIAIPVFMSILIDEGVNAYTINSLGEKIYAPNTEIIYTYGTLMVVSAIIALIFGVLVTKVTSRVSSEFGKNIRQAQFEKIQEYSFENLDNFKTSSLITRMTMDANTIVQSTNMILRVALRSPALIIFSVATTAIFAPSLALIFLLVTPILVIGFYFIMRFAHRQFIKMFSRIDNLNLTVQEDLIAIRNVKSYVREDYEIERFNNAAKDLKDVAIKAERIVIFNRPLMQFTIGLTFVLIGWFGSQLFVGGNLTEGQFANTVVYINQVLFSLMMISQVFIMIVMSRTSVNRINEVLEEKPLLTEVKNPDYEVLDGSFKFEDVSFRYSQDLGSKYVLENINLDVPSGSVVGIFSSTGAGKSTLVQLLSRLYDVSKGTVYVGGKDVRNYAIKSLREEVILVLQKNVLFSGTVRENIKWGKKDATDEEIIAVLKKAQAYDFVMAMEHGLDTWIEQGGVNVSGGQRQRLTIARALIANPKILILDDSTSAVDTKTEAKITEALRKENPDMTKVIISQRLFSIENADIIILLDNQTIAAKGTHDELYKSNDMYREIYDTQSKAKEVEE